MSERVFQEIMKQAGSLGARVRPRYPGVGASVRPTYLRSGLGAPAERVGEMADETTIQYSDNEYNSGGVTYLPLGTTIIAAGAANVLIGPLRPYRDFAPQKFVLPSTVIGLLLNEINIEGLNLLASNLGMPVEAFSEVSILPQIIFPTILPATGVSFVVSNPTGNPLEFSPAFYGTDIRRG